MDLWNRVVTYVNEGGSKAEAARRLKVCPATVYNWFNREDLPPTVVKRRRRKLDWTALAQHVKDYPDARLSDRAAHFGVNIHAIWYALKQMKITRKKKQQKYRERNSQERQAYLKQVQTIVKRHGSKHLVYIDECGFDNRVSQIWGWAKRGTKLFANRTGKREKRENLLMARCKDNLLAPMLIQGSVDAGCFEKWRSEWVLPTLEVPSVLILDNAPIHRKNVIRDIAYQCAH